MRMGEGGTTDFERKETCLMLMADNGVGRVLVLPRNWGMALERNLKASVFSKYNHPLLSSGDWF